MFEDEILYHLDHKAIAKWQEEKYTSVSFWRKVKNLNTDEIEEIRASKEELERIEMDFRKLNIDSIFFSDIVADLYGSDLLESANSSMFAKVSLERFIGDREHTHLNLMDVAAAYIRDGLMKQ